MSNAIIIGISGPSASGKSLLANTIVTELGSDQVAVIPEDCYYADLAHMPMEERTKVNFDHPDAFDHSLLVEHIKALVAGKAIDMPTYDFTEHTRSDKTVTINGQRIIVLEGILLFSDERLRQLMDIRIFMDTPLDICLIRRMTRDIVDRGRSLHSVISQYQQTVRPMYYQFIEPCKRHADVIVPRGGENRIAIDIIKAKMRELLIQS